MVIIAVSIAVGVGVVVVKEDGFVGEVSGKGDSSDSETGKRALESVPARKGTSVSPDKNKQFLLQFHLFF